MQTYAKNMKIYSGDVECDTILMTQTRMHSMRSKSCETTNVQPLLISSLQTFYGCHHDLTDRYDDSISQIRLDIFQ